MPGLRKRLAPDQKVITDDGRADDTRNTALNEEMPNVARALRARHEAANRRLKQFFALSHVFRHSLRKRSVCFHAAAVLAQLMIENGEPLFEV